MIYTYYIQELEQGVGGQEIREWQLNSDLCVAMIQPPFFPLHIVNAGYQLRICLTEEKTSFFLKK